MALNRDFLNLDITNKDILVVRARKPLFPKDVNAAWMPYQYINSNNICTVEPYVEL